MEFGIFNDEGLLEDGFFSEEEARNALHIETGGRYDEDEHAHVAEICHDHPENERDNCEDCV